VCSVIGPHPATCGTSAEHDAHLARAIADGTLSQLLVNGLAAQNVVRQTLARAGRRSVEKDAAMHAYLHRTAAEDERKLRHYNGLL